MGARRCVLRAGFEQHVSTRCHGAEPVTARRHEGPRCFTWNRAVAEWAQRRRSRRRLAIAGAAGVVSTGAATRGPGAGTDQSARTVRGSPAGHGACSPGPATDAGHPARRQLLTEGVRRSMTTRMASELRSHPPDTLLGEHGRLLRYEMDVGLMCHRPPVLGCQPVPAAACSGCSTDPGESSPARRLPELSSRSQLGHEIAASSGYRRPPACH